MDWLRETFGPWLSFQKSKDEKEGLNNLRIGLSTIIVAHHAGMPYGNAGWSFQKVHKEQCHEACLPCVRTGACARVRRCTQTYLCAHAHMH